MAVASQTRVMLVPIKLQRIIIVKRKINEKIKKDANE
jgi:hypothetical protein